MASRRNYVTTTEVDELAGITSTDLQISEAEEIIDAWVGPQNKHIESIYTGRASAGGGSTITLESTHQNIYDVDYFKYCQIEIIGGTGAGQKRVCTTSTKAGVLTVDSAWTTAPDSTSFYKIYQLGKFPRVHDVEFYSTQSPSTYYKSIPEAVRRATAAQVEYMVAMGDDFFKTDAMDKQSESIGDYSYSKGGVNSSGVMSISKVIAPKARALLRGIKNVLGEITL